MRVKITDRAELERLEAEYKRTFGVEPNWTPYPDPVEALRESIERREPLPDIYDPWTLY